MTAADLIAYAEARGWTARPLASMGAEITALTHPAAPHVVVDVASFTRRPYLSARILVDRRELATTTKRGEIERLLDDPTLIAPTIQTNTQGEPK